MSDEDTDTAIKKTTRLQKHSNKNLYISHLVMPEKFKQGGSPYVSYKIWYSINKTL